MKRLRVILLTNGVGLFVLLFVLFGTKSFSSLFRSTGAIKNHRSVEVERQALKEFLSQYSDERLLKMYLAGQEILDWNRVLEKAGSHVVHELLKGQGMFLGMEHYPKHDAYDKETFAQYYYHSHRKEEHGHFHLFLRQGGMPEGVLPKFYDGRNDTMSDVDTFSHLIAISMDDEGYPIKLFTTNRWVTGEDWYRNEDVCKMIDLFQIEHTHPSWVTNKWLSSMLRLFYPQISELVLRREQDLEMKSQADTLVDAMEDYQLDVLSELEISVEAQVDVLSRLIKERGIEIPL
jgi:hypothetical protein